MSMSLWGVPYHSIDPNTDDSDFFVFIEAPRQQLDI